MTIPFELEGSTEEGDIVRATMLNRCDRSGPIVYTEERVKRNYVAQALLNSQFGVEQNQDASFGGTPVVIHDGVDSIAWQGTNVIGTSVDFTSTNRPLNGLRSVEVDSPDLGDVWQFDKGSTIDLSAYTALRGNVNIDSDWTNGDSVAIYGYDTSSGLQVGVSVLLEDYINVFEFDSWQVFVIPLEDMGLEVSTIDSIRMEQVGKHGKTGLFYIDDFQIEETSGLIEFVYAPTRSQVFHLELISHYVVNNVTEEVMKSYDKYYGETALTNGVVISVKSDGRTQVSLGTRQLSDFTQFPHIRSFEAISDGVNTQAKITTEFPKDFDGRKEDFFKYSISDDLSTLLQQRVFLFGWLEEVD